MTKYRIKRPKMEELAHLDRTEAIVEEGMDMASIQYFVNWISDLAGTVNDEVEVYLIKGEMLNKAWSLTGDNRYPDDLNIVAVSFDEIDKPGRLAIPRFSVDARWWSDILSNNLRREEEKKERENA